MSNGVLYVGDNLEVLRLFFSDLVDLIYLDPPFNTGRKFISADGAKSGSFNDVWNWSMIPQDWSDQLRSDWPDLYQLVDLSGRTHSQAMSSFLCFMAVRLIELHRVLKHTGSIFLHCDPTASHYLKAIMDRIFGSKNFRNEIIWSYRKMPNNAKHFQKNHGTILFYSKGPEYTFNKQYEDYTEATKRNYERAAKVGYNINYKKGMATVWDWNKYNAAIEAGKIRDPDKLKPVEFEGKGSAMRAVWDIPILAPTSKERTGYPTQKPLALLDRILRAACPEGGVVLDPFAGSGTTLLAAELLNMEWIGIDIWDGLADLLGARFRSRGLEAQIDEVTAP